MSLPATKILLTTSYDLSVPGGVNNQLWSLYHELKNRTNYQLKILASASAPLNPPNEDVITMGKVIRMRINGSDANISLDPRIGPKVKKLLDEYQPDIIHLQEPLNPILNYFVLRYSKSKNIGTFHAYSDDHWKLKLARPLLRGNFKKLHLKLAVSEAAKSFIAHNFPGPYKIIPNSVELVEEAPVGKKLFPDDKKMILFVGRLNEPRKGFKYLLKAFELLEKNHPGQYRLLVVGADYEKWKMKNTQGDIQWLGSVTEEKLREIYCTADLLCAPSTGKESFGVILLEAFSHGKPVAGFNISGYNAVVEQGKNGLLVENMNHSALAQAIHKILADPALYDEMSRYAKEYVKKFDRRVVTDQIISLYEELLN